MITLTDIAYVRSGVADLEAAVRFATDIVGLELAAPAEPGLAEAGVAHLRADHRHHCLALVEGPSGVISSGFAVADSDALAAAETELEAAGFRVRRGDPAAGAVPAGPGVHRVRRPVRQPAGTREPAGDDHPAGRVHPAGRDHRVRPPVPGRAGRARGLPVLEHPVQRAGLGLARRRRLPDPDRPGAPQAGRVPRRAARAVPHELPGGHHRRRVPELAFPGRARRRDRDGPRAPPPVHRDLPVLPGPGGLHLRVLVRRAPDRGRRGLAAAHLRPGRARVHRHVARDPCAASPPSPSSARRQRAGQPAAARPQPPARSQPARSR